MERVAKDNNVPSKTIDHIADVSKKVSLTEQWKNRELKGGGYYVELKNGEIFSDYFGGLEFSRIYNCEIKQILAPVPSYEEYKVLEYRSSRFSIRHFEKENAKLKDLLKKWIHFYPIILYEYEDTLKTKDIVELFDRTNEVLK